MVAPGGGAVSNERSAPVIKKKRKTFLAAGVSGACFAPSTSGTRLLRDDKG